MIEAKPGLNIRITPGIGGTGVLLQVLDLGSGSSRRWTDGP